MNFFIPLNKMIASNGLHYGMEWPLDAFDRHVDRLLLANSSREICGSPCTPRVAIDIGCGMGERSHQLATLGIFDRILACDIVDVSETIALRNQAILRKKARATSDKTTPITFHAANAVNLTSTTFNASDIAFINCRNVGHFLAPQDFRKVLATIYDIASDNASVAISFDAFKEIPQRLLSDPTTMHLFKEHKVSSLFDDIPEFYKHHSEEKAPYTQYRKETVQDFMESLGFDISTDEVPNEWECRPREWRILATVHKKSGIHVKNG